MLHGLTASTLVLLMDSAETRMRIDPEHLCRRLDPATLRFGSMAEVEPLTGIIGLRQGIAVTGSINQHGEIQALGGVTTKIEEFFAVCR
jgi:hypothetical protein